MGDQTIIVKSKVNSNVALNRRNYILKSNISSFTYTGIGVMVLSATIGKYCSIGWNVSIGGGEHLYRNVSTFPGWRFNALDTGNYVANKAKRKPIKIYVK